MPVCWVPPGLAFAAALGSASASLALASGPVSQHLRLNFGLKAHLRPLSPGDESHIRTAGDAVMALHVKRLVKHVALGSPVEVIVYKGVIGGRKGRM